MVGSVLVILVWMHSHNQRWPESLDYASVRSERLLEFCASGQLEWFVDEDLSPTSLMAILTPSRNRAKTYALMDSTTWREITPDEAMKLKLSHKKLTFNVDTTGPE
jgi:hypothetical protein